MVKKCFISRLLSIYGNCPFSGPESRLFGHWKEAIFGEKWGLEWDLKVVGKELSTTSAHSTIT